MTQGRTAEHGEEEGHWSAVRGDGTIVATAIHHGRRLRPEAQAKIRLSPAERLREEDPHTGDLIRGVPTRVIAHRSRFEVDLNRAREDAVYRTAPQAWGLEVWKEEPSDGFVLRSLHVHDGFYIMMRSLLDGIVREHGAFVLLDVHSYNHRRKGPLAPPAPPDKAPDVNIGTFSMPPGRWEGVLSALEDTVRSYDHLGRRLHVGRNVAFQGRGALTRFVHDSFPTNGCAIALEFKKFFMDEWSGVPDRAEIDSLQRLVTGLVPILDAALAGTVRR